MSTFDESIKRLQDFYKNSPNTVLTTPFFWDCECVENHIHVCSMTVCHKCGAHSCQQPDSRLNEVIDYLINRELPKEKEFTFFFKDGTCFVGRGNTFRSAVDLAFYAEGNAISKFHWFVDSKGNGAWYENK